MTRTLLFLGMVAIPFSAFNGLPLLGELAPELSTYFFIPAVGSAMLAYIVHGASGMTTQFTPSPRILTAIMLVTVGIIMMSFVANAASIMTISAGGRYAFAKFATSLAVVLYGFALSYVYFFEAGRDWHRLVFKPIAISALICVVYSVFEILSKKGGIASGFFGALDDFVHAGWNPSVYNAGWDERIRSVSFEAPAFGNYVGFAWPWLMAAWIDNTSRSRRGYFVVWLLLTAIELYSFSRTAIVMMGGSIALLALLRYGYMPARFRPSGRIMRRLLTVAILAASALVVAVAASKFERYEASVIAGSSVSDLTRLAYTEATVKMMVSHPAFGLGLGQFAFWLLDYVPSWAYLSYEVADWAAHAPPVHYWPATYSVYGRLASELGAVGLVAWIVLWVGLGQQILVSSLDHQKRTGLLPAVAFPLIVSCACVLLSGLTTDTFRSPMIWITLGLSCRFLSEARRNAGRHAREVALRTRYFTPSALASGVPGRTHHPI